jgi:(p)ppGpp synthase/HD superfamily hydrolase
MYFAIPIYLYMLILQVGAQINGQPARYDYELRNGDVVSITTSKPGPGEDPRYLATIAII